MPRALIPLRSRLLSKALINLETGCWVWTGGHDRDGYGKLEGRFAHRIAYEMWWGPVPRGLLLDHLCWRRDCINPAHLEPVTVLENNMRGRCPAAVNAAKTHCDHGHPFDEVNTYISPYGWRQCKVCIRRLTRESRARKKLALAHAAAQG